MALGFDCVYLFNSVTILNCLQGVLVGDRSGRPPQALAARTLSCVTVDGTPKQVDLFGR